MSLGVLFPLQLFGISVSSSLNISWDSPVKPSDPGLLFVGSFFKLWFPFQYL